MTSQFAPAATPGGSAQSGPPVCANCSTSTTPLWRRDESGSVLCNACGLFLKLHGRPRPISLKTDVIKSRNRVKTSQPKKRDSNGGQDGLGHIPNGYPAAHPDSGPNAHSHNMPIGVGLDQAQRVPSPTSASNGNGSSSAQHSLGAAHIFDTVSLPSDTFASPSLPAFALRQPSPTPAPLNGHGPGDSAQSYESLISHNNALRTRVSELEVINDLFRGRVAELEASEEKARRNENLKFDEVQRLAAQLQAANARAAEMEDRLTELEEGPARKKQRAETDNTEDSSDTGAHRVENGHSDAE